MDRAKVIRNYVNTIAMKGIMKEKGWTKEEATTHASNFLTCGKKISPAEYFNSIPSALAVESSATCQ